MRFIHKYLRKHTRGQELRRDFHSVGYGLLGVTLFLFFWALCGYMLFSKPGYKQFSGFLPLPALDALLLMVTEADFWNSVIASLRRVLTGISIAFIIGFPFGLLIGFYSKLRIITYPPVQFLRMISPLSWMPIALLVFASFESAICFLITMATVWPIILNTMLGVRHVNPQWIKMAQCQGANKHQLIFHIAVPASVPYILTSLRLALGVAWIVLVPAEFLGVSSGLGYMINDARDTMEYDRLMAIIIAIGILGFLLDWSIQLTRKWLNWFWR